MSIEVCSICSEKLVPNESGHGMCRKCYNHWYYKKNKKEIKDYAAKWQKENRPKRRVIEQRYRDNRRKKNPLPPKFNGPCIKCGATESYRGRWVLQMCRSCYKKSKYEKAKPKKCIDCGTTIPPKNRTGRCRSCQQRYRWRNDKEYQKQHKARSKKYSQTKKGKITNRMHLRKRRAKLAEVENTLTKEEWEAVLKQYDYKCAYCGSKDELEMDHIIPISKDGPNIIHNVIPACVHCNRSKRDQLPPVPVQPVLL